MLDDAAAAVFRAIEGHDADGLRRLVAERASAARNGNPAMIELLRAHGADTAIANDEGRTPTDLVTGDAAAEVRTTLR